MTLGAALLNSCDSTDDTCGGLNYTTYEAINFSGMPVEITGTSNAGQLIQIATYTNQTVAYDSIGIELNYDLNEIGMIKEDFSFMKSAYACSLIPPYDYLYQISIYSDTDYNAAYPAGTDLSPIVRLSVDLSIRLETTPLDEELDGSTLMVTFVEAPDQLSTHEFRIELDLIERSSTVQVAQVTIRP